MDLMAFNFARDIWCPRHAPMFVSASREQKKVAVERVRLES